MGRFTRQFTQLLRQFQRWEVTAQIGFVLAILLAVLALITAQTLAAVRVPALIGGIGALFTAQLIFMWANRGMVTSFTTAQRHYLQGEFNETIAILEALRTADEADFKALTLLGNTYRQLGDLAKSEAILYEAINIKPNHYFPLYGFGRTLLSKGCYAEAVEAYQKALALGAPLSTHFDLGESLYRADQFEDAKKNLLLVTDMRDAEPYRVLMAMYLLHQLGEPFPLTPEQIDEGLPYWQMQAELFSDTVYGQVVKRDITHLSLMREEI